MRQPCDLPRKKLCLSPRRRRGRRWRFHSGTSSRRATEEEGCEERRVFSVGDRNPYFGTVHKFHLRPVLALNREQRAMGLLSNRIGRESLKAGDHIYSWRTAYIYAHHGIYVGDNKVIHFTRGNGQEVGSGTALDLLLLSSGPAHSQVPCTLCSYRREELNGVVSSCLDCFLAGGVLYRFEYDVNPAVFIAKVRGGTCTLAVSDTDDVVVHRAIHLLSKGFRCYNVFKSNCEDFAIYCKTGLLVVDKGVVGQSGQAISIIGGPVAAVFSTPIRLLTTNPYGMTVAAVGVYCASRYFADIGNRRDVVKVAVEDLTSQLATARVQLVDENGAPISPAALGDGAGGACSSKSSASGPWIPAI